MKNKALHWMTLSLLSIANATTWFFFFQQINTYINH
jgi:hypothetical protein